MGAVGSLVQAAQQQIDAQRASFQQAGAYKQQARDLEYQANVALSNSNLSRYQGDIAAADQYRQDYQAMGRQAASQAQGGILGSVTGDSLLAQSESEAAKSQRRIRLQTNIQSGSLLADSIGLRAQASAAKRNARVAIFEGVMGPFAQPFTDHMNVANAFR